MSQAINHHMGGEFATARRGGIGAEDLAFIADKLLAGVPVSSIAQMVGHPASEVAMISAGLPRKRRKEYRQPRPPVVFLRDFTLPPSPMEQIAKEVAQARDVTLAGLRGPRRTKALTQARQEAMWRISELKRYSLPQIGAYFGGRHHTTVMHAMTAHLERAAAGEPGAVEKAAHRPAKARMLDTLKSVARYYGLTVEELIAPAAPAAFRVARDQAAWRLRKREYGCESIAQTIGLSVAETKAAIARHQSRLDQEGDAA